MLFIALGLPCWCDSGLSALPVPRKVLALYDSKDSARPDKTLIYTNVEAIGDYLGLVFEYHDIRKGLPEHSDMGDYRGILSWFTDDQMPNPAGYCRWLLQETEQGRYMIIFGALGAGQDDNGDLVPFGLLKKLYRTWGVDYPGAWHQNPLLVQPVRLDPRMMNFERPLTRGELSECAEYDQFTPLEGAGVETILSLKSALSDRPPSAVVFIHPHGGLALGSYALFVEPESYARRWYMNPFLFLHRSLRCDGIPRVDTTTLNGCRIFYSHVDGDGSTTLSEFERVHLTVETLYTEVLSKINLPITVSAVEGEITTAGDLPWIKNSSRVAEPFRRIFALPNIEAGAHGFTHPLNWSTGLTAIAIHGYSRKTKPEPNSGEESAAFLIPPRPDWEKREILGSMDFIEKHLLPPGKHCQLFQWTGNCRPEESALALCDRHDILNINGGDPIFDGTRPSYTGLSPAVRQLGKFFQVQTSGANENLYTEHWTRNFGGFSDVVETWKRTGHPRRIKPINSYYHFYSAQKLAGLNAVKKTYQYCLGQELAPLFTSEFIKIVRNSRAIRLFKEDRTWSWTGARECRTLRWEGAGLWPDLSKSAGVIGFYLDSELDCLFVHLDGSGEGYLQLTNRPPKQAYLSRATGFIDHWTDGKELRFVFLGKGPSWIELAGLETGKAYTCSLDGRPRQLRTNRNGVLTISVPKELQYRTVRVRVQR